MLLPQIYKEGENMPRRAREKSSSGIYHIIWKGANRQEIYHDDEDRKRFLEILMKNKIKQEIAVYAWCLMGNHVHLLLKEGKEDISITMKRIGISYVSYYNLKYLTTGSLFQNRFISVTVETVLGIQKVVRYIHQNPVKAGMVVHPVDWQWSSCLGYYGKNLYPKNLLHCLDVLRLFSDDIKVARERFKDFNEYPDNDQCLEDTRTYRRICDEEAGKEIKLLIGDIEIPQIKSLPRKKRNEALRKVKRIEGLSVRQAARILGVSESLIHRA